MHLGGLTGARETAPVGVTQPDLDAVWKKLYAYADRNGAFRNEALPRVIDHLDPTDWERDLALGYVFHGHRDAGGLRLVDHFIATRGRELSRGEMAATVALREAWASLFEVVSMHAGLGVELRDLRSGKLHRVRELLATARAQPGDVMFAWLMTVGDHLALTGPACMIPRQHCEGVRAAIEAELAVVQGRWPGVPERELVGSTAWTIADAMRTAARNELARGFAPAPANAPCSVTYHASHAPAPDEWLAIGDPPKRAAIEAHHRALWVTAPPIHTELHLVVENQLAAGDPPEARATLERLVEEGLDRHEAIHAVGSVVATALWDITRLEAPFDRDAMARSLADLRASDWRGEGADSPEPSAAPSDQIPPLAHEVMYGLVLGFREAIERAVEHTRRGGWKEMDVLDPEALIKRSNLEEYLFPLGHALMAAGWDKRSTLLELRLLSVHAFNVLSYQLHRRKTFWVDESLAFMLACTRLDVRGEGIRLPFPSFALVFTDRETLGLAEALAARDDVATVRGKRLRALTVYVTRVPAARGALGLHVCLMLDAGIEQWPWLVTRDLDISPDHTLDEILDSHFPGVANPDPIFATGELRQLLALTVNAILFATSSPSWPELGPTPRAPEASSTPRHRAMQHPGPERTGERVWHLPGKIPISQVRALRKLRNSHDHGPLFSRFMVRGHWRRALNTWHDQSARWIEPYWRGPALADIVEREYQLKP